MRAVVSGPTNVGGLDREASARALRIGVARRASGLLAPETDRCVRPVSARREIDLRVGRVSSCIDVQAPRHQRGRPAGSFTRGREYAEGNPAPTASDSGAIRASPATKPVPAICLCAPTRADMARSRHNARASRLRRSIRAISGRGVRNSPDTRRGTAIRSCPCTARWGFAPVRKSRRPSRSARRLPSRERRGVARRHAVYISLRRRPGLSQQRAPPRPDPPRCAKA